MYGNCCLATTRFLPHIDRLETCSPVIFVFCYLPFLRLVVFPHSLLVLACLSVFCVSGFNSLSSFVSLPPISLSPLPPHSFPPHLPPSQKYYQSEKVSKAISHEARSAGGGSISPHHRSLSLPVSLLFLTVSLSLFPSLYLSVCPLTPQLLGSLAPSVCVRPSLSRLTVSALLVLCLCLSPCLPALFLVSLPLGLFSRVPASLFLPVCLFPSLPAGASRYGALTLMQYYYTSLWEPLSGFAGVRVRTRNGGGGRREIERECEGERRGIGKEYLPSSIVPSLFLNFPFHPNFPSFLLGSHPPLLNLVSW